MGEAEANPVRGEISVDLGDPPRTFVLRPDYTALRTIEKKCEKGLLRLAMEASAGNLTLDDTAIIIAECVRAQGRSIADQAMALYSEDVLGPMVVDAPDGAAGIQGRICSLLTLAASGGYSAAGELKAARPAATN